MRYKAIVEYLGTHYRGWQAQEGLKTVQGVIETALNHVAQERVEVFAAGRTDAGVHAVGQVIHFDCARSLTAYQLREGANFHLHHETVRFSQVEEVSPEFHARFDAQKRSYKYFILNRPAPSPLWQDRAWHFKWPLDVRAMQQAALHLIGYHDFSSFRSKECQSSQPVRTLDDITFQQEDDWIRVDFVSKSFLHHQVRIMMGTLAEVGAGKRSAEEIPDIIAAKDRAAAGLTAPACGLYFMNVKYDKTGSTVDS